MKLAQAHATLQISVILLWLAAGAAWAGTEGDSSTFYGLDAGASGSDASGQNTFVGRSAGTSATGSANTFLGFSAGFSDTSGYANTFIGHEAGYTNDIGYNNTFIGSLAGFFNIAGHGNVFLGRQAGLSETGSNKLYIDDCQSGGNCTSPMIYGEFDHHLLRINAATHVAADGVAKSQMHFSLNNADSGGFLTSVSGNNFFVSSGARYAGGWIQRSSDTQAVIAGSGGLGYRIFADSGNSVGAAFTPTVRLHIDYSGNLGLNTMAVAGTPIMHSSGAHLTAGGVWTDASSRSYKEHIEALSTEEALRTLAGLNPVKFNYKADRDEKYVGFIAEDVPDLVARKDRQSLAPMDIVAVLTKVVREQQAQIAALMAQMEAMQSTLAAAPARAQE